MSEGFIQGIHGSSNPSNGVEGLMFADSPISSNRYVSPTMYEVLPRAKGFNPDFSTSSFPSTSYSDYDTSQIRVVIPVKNNTVLVGYYTGSVVKFTSHSLTVGTDGVAESLGSAKVIGSKSMTGVKNIFRIDSNRFIIFGQSGSDSRYYLCLATANSDFTSVTFGSIFTGNSNYGTIDDAETRVCKLISDNRFVIAAANNSSSSRYDFWFFCVGDISGTSINVVAFWHGIGKDYYNAADYLCVGKAGDSEHFYLSSGYGMHYMTVSEIPSWKDTYFTTKAVSSSKFHFISEYNGDSYGVIVNNDNLSLYKLTPTSAQPILNYDRLPFTFNSLIYRAVDIKTGNIFCGVTLVDSNRRYYYCLFSFRIQDIIKGSAKYGYSIATHPTDYASYSVCSYANEIGYNTIWCEILDGMFYFGYFNSSTLYIVSVGAIVSVHESTQADSYILGISENSASQNEVISVISNRYY